MVGADTKGNNMRVHRGLAAAVLATAVAGIGTVTASSATAEGSGSGTAKVVASGLEGPFGLQAGHRGFLVAESDAGQVTGISRDGDHHVLLSGVPGVAGVAGGHRHFYAVLGGSNEQGPPPAGTYPQTSVLRSTYNGKHVKVLANLLKYELRHNPDHQKQFDKNHNPYEALSNPFSMNLSRYGLLVADGGGNDVLRVNPWTGKVSTFFVPPTVKDVPACLQPGAQSNPGTVGCDSVPTGIAVARHSIYVSTLGAEVPGAGRVYRLNPWTGKVLHVWKGLTAPTGIAVTRDGTIYVSEVLYGAPETETPPPGFDPSTVGRITRIRCGHVTHAQVTMPVGLSLSRGRLYSTAWSVAGQLGMPGAGQIVQVRRSAFH
jgi:hypothetical protein